MRGHWWCCCCRSADCCSADCRSVSRHLRREPRAVAQRWVGRSWFLRVQGAKSLPGRHWPGGQAYQCCAGESGGGARVGVQAARRGSGNRGPLGEPRHVPGDGAPVRGAGASAPARDTSSGSRRNGSQAGIRLPASAGQRKTAHRFAMGRFAQMHYEVRCTSETAIEPAREARKDNTRSDNKRRSGDSDSGECRSSSACAGGTV